MEPKRVLKGLAKVGRSARIVGRTRYALSREAEEKIFAVAEVMSEGTPRAHRDGSGTYFGSTMLSVPVSALAEHWRGPFDAVEQARVLHLLEGSVRVRLRAMRIARLTASERISRGTLGTLRAEISVRLTNGAFHIDVDFEAPIELSSRAAKS